MVEFSIKSSNVASFFSTKVHVAYQNVYYLSTSLDTFKNQVYGGIYDIRFGEFGPEYASGAFQVRLHFQERGKFYVTVNSQSEFEKFGIKHVAIKAKLYFSTEPALLDDFIKEFKDLGTKHRNDANLDSIICQWA